MIKGLASIEDVTFYQHQPGLMQTANLQRPFIRQAVYMMADHVPRSTNWKTSRSTGGHLNIARPHHRDAAARFQSVRLAVA